MPSAAAPTLPALSVAVMVAVPVSAVEGTVAVVEKAPEAPVGRRDRARAEHRHGGSLREGQRDGLVHGKAGAGDRAGDAGQTAAGRCAKTGRRRPYVEGRARHGAADIGRTKLGGTGGRG